MGKNVSFIATMKMCVKEKTYFGFVYHFAQYAMRLTALFALLMIWRSLFLGGADTEGMTLHQVYAYTVLSTALYPLMNVRTPASGWLHDGSMLSVYLRPAGVFSQLISHTVGGWTTHIACLSVPVIVFASFFGIDMRPKSMWFFVSLALSVAEGFAVDFLFSCLLIRLKNLEWCVHSLREALSALLTGAVIPFACLPWGLGTVLSLSPFASLAGAPLGIFTGLTEPAGAIIMQVVWNLVLWPLSVYLFKASGERMVSYGG